MGERYPYDLTDTQVKLLISALIAALSVSQSNTDRYVGLAELVQDIEGQGNDKFGRSYADRMDNVRKVTVTMVNRGTGGVQVHRHGCADTKRNIRGAAVWDTEVTCYADVVRGIYPPDDFSYDAETEWRDFDGDITVMPCCPALTGK